MKKILALFFLLISSFPVLGESGDAYFCNRLAGKMFDHYALKRGDLEPSDIETDPTSGFRWKNGKILFKNEYGEFEFSIKYKFSVSNDYLKTEEFYAVATGAKNCGEYSSYLAFSDGILFSVNQGISGNSGCKKEKYVAVVAYNCTRF